METTRGVSRRRATKATGTAGTTPIPSGRGKRRRFATAAAATTVVLGATMALLAPISVADTPNTDGSRSKAPRTVQVSGQLVPLDAGGFRHKVTGELIGTWRFPDAAYNKVYYASDTRVVARGVESFDGCLNVNGNDKCDASEPSGTFSGEYMYWASYDGNGRLIDGGCTHALTGGTKAFKGVRGLFHMRDVFSATTPTGSIASYQGEVVLNAVDEDPVAQSETTTVAARASSGGISVGC